MSHYAIGDVQGCFDSLMALLKEIQYDDRSDILWFTGDLVNRGPRSLDTLRFIKSLKTRAKTVLGNHDLTLLAAYYCKKKLPSADSTLENILLAKDRDELCTWLQSQPLLYHDAHFNTVMVHAGILPIWSLETAKELAKEAEFVIQGDKCSAFFHNMFGNEPKQWQDDLKGFDRIRCIVNAFTRLRFCQKDSTMEFDSKGNLLNPPSEHDAWFRWPLNIPPNLRILFGHWAALKGHCDTPNIMALDTGCVWGNTLTALRLEDNALFTVSARESS